MSRSEVFEFGEFRLDARERRLSRGRATIPLAPKAHALLLTLVRRAGQLTTKHELLALVWPDAFVEESILAVHVSNLRKALGCAGGDRRYIETVPRSGYRFVAPVRLVEPEARSAAAGSASLAVLPFKPLARKTRDRSLEIGVADSLIVRFSGLRSVAVPPLSAVRKYSALDVDSLAAARELQVPFIVDGTIHCRNGRMQITARLLSVADGRTQWEAAFDDPFSRIFDAENAIVQQVAKVLDLETTPEHWRRATAHPTRSSDAYGLYLRGRYLWERRTDENARKAIRCFEAAIVKDPEYALAWTGLSACYATLPLVTGVQPKAAFPKARAAALRALELDDSLCEAHASLAGVKFWHDWDWHGAEREFRCAIDLNPNEASTHRFFGHFLSNMGRHDDGLREVRRALEIEPLSIVTNARLGQFLYHAGEYAQALEQLENTIELDPNFWMTHLVLGRVLEITGKRAEAINALRKAQTLSKTSAETQAALGYALADSGETAEAQAVCNELTERHARGLSSAYHVALVCAGLRDPTNMRAWLSRALDDRDVGLTFMRVEPRWRAYEHDPIVRQVMARVALPDSQPDRVAIS